MWYANDAAVELWSAKSLEELLKRDFSTDMSESTKHRLDDCLFKFSSDENCVIKEQWTFYPNQQGPKTVDTRCKGISIEEGRLAMLLHGTIKETTSETEQQALRSVEMLRHLPVAVCLMDIDGNVKEQNPEALSVFGSIDNTTTTIAKENKEDRTGDNGSEDTAFVKRFVDKELGQRVLKEARSGKEVHRLEALQNTVLGPRWSAVQVRQTKDPVTSDPILLYSSRDITAVVEAKRQAVAADVAKMDLLADMAHAIRTPLQHVVGVVELMSREQATSDHSPEQDSRYSNLLQSSAQLLMTVLHDMMRSVNNPADYNVRPTISATSPTTMDPPQLPSNRIKLEHAQIDVRQVVDSTIATIAPHAQVKDLSVKAQVTSHLRNVSVMGDANRLGQVLFEILHNAVKYTSRGGIAITVRRLSKKRARRVRLRFEVKDSGVGLNLEQQRNCLRSRSWRRDNQQTSSEGVGLELCKSLVEAMGGSIGVQSKPGRGTTFWFEIPFLRAAVVTTSKACSDGLTSSSSSGGPSSDMRIRRRRSTSSLDPVLDDCGDEEDGGLQILLVDEDNVGRNVMTALLEQSGHSVTTATDGAAMVEAVSQESFDVVLVETQLPSAFEATREVRTKGYSPESLPILALTAAVPRADYPELGFNDWLTKPMLIKDIQKAMTNAICNVGTKSAGTGSVFTAEDNYSLDGSVSLGASSIGHSTMSCGSLIGRGKAGPSMPRRGSFNSIQSAFSDHLQAVLGTPKDFPKDEEVATNKANAAAENPSIARIPSNCSKSSCSQKSDRPPRMIRRSLPKQ